MKKIRLFLGGTRAGSKWREELIEMIDQEQFEIYDSSLRDAVLGITGEETDDLFVYVITPEEDGFFSFAAAVDSSNKRPDKTILCPIRIYKGSTYEFMARKSIANILRLVVRNGSTVFTNMESLADYLNEYSSFKTETKVIR